MSFLWADYLNVARHLTEHSDASDYSEACLRSAISRAYYGALNTARNLLRDHWGIEVPETAEIHQFVPRWFMDEEDLDCKEIGTLLDRLRDRRRKADYSDEITKTSSLAKRSIADAQLLIDRISTM
ncbi:MAG: HEPN domain-containing protein [Chloroflexota bacterium]